MKTVKNIIIIILSCYYSIVMAQSQSVDSINYELDNTFYPLLNNIDYKTSIELPDSTKKKVINILNGYLPLQEIRKATFFNDNVIKNIERISKEICGIDSLCNALAKDSIMKCTVESQLYNLRQYIFPANFILAVGSWDVKEAEPILLGNIDNDKKYPKREILLALAKLGNDSILKIVNEMYTVDYIVNNTVLKKDNPDLPYKSIPVEDQMSHLINYFYDAGMYLKNKDILLHLIDLLDIQGKIYSTETSYDDQKNVYLSEIVSPIEESMLMWLGPRFMSKENIENGKYYEFESVIDNFLYLVDKYKNTKKIKEILSKENKEKIKKKLKDWINENIPFE